MDRGGTRNRLSGMICRLFSKTTWGTAVICWEWLTTRGWSFESMLHGAADCCSDVTFDSDADAAGAGSVFSLSLANFFFLGAFR